VPIRVDDAGPPGAGCVDVLVNARRLHRIYHKRGCRQAERRDGDFFAHALRFGRRP
jgi:hypothetical protein